MAFPERIPSEHEMQSTTKLNSSDPNRAFETDSNKLGEGEPSPWMRDIPDGGLEAWLVLLGNWCASFVTFGWINSS
jgi:hypothetical protein